MARKLKSDKWLFTATLVLVCASLVMVYSASAVIAMDRFQKPTYFLFKQATFALIGLVLMPVLMKIDYRRYRQPAVIWTAMGLVGLPLVTVLFRPPLHGAHRWFGIAGIGVQPPEFPKIPLLFFLPPIPPPRME